MTRSLHAVTASRSRWLRMIHLLLLALVAASFKCPTTTTTAAAAYTQSFQLHRRLATTTTATAAYQHCLTAWRQENLGLVLLPPPFILDQGDADTGVGFQLLRIPPGGLKEGIVDYYYSDDSDSKVIIMTYKILNPGWFTWPVQEHEGRICFSTTSATAAAAVLLDKSTGTTSEMSSSTQLYTTTMEWTVQWTPLAVPGPLQEPWQGFLMLLTRLIVTRAADHVAFKANGVSVGCGEA